MKFLKKVITLALAFVIVMSVAGCNRRDDISKGLSIYTIDAVLNMDNKTIDVKQTVDYANLYDVELDSLWFHLYPNAFREGARFSAVPLSESDKAYMNGVSYGSIEIKSVKINGAETQFEIGGQDEDILMLTLSKGLMPTQRITVDMDYTLKIPNVRHRFGYGDGWINLGNFYPIACVYENGEFESSPYYSVGDPFYSEIANYRVSITTPINLKAAMSGKTSSSVSGNTTKWTASADAMRDFAIVVGDFQTKTTTVNGVEINYYYMNDAESDMSLQIAKESLEYFSRVFGDYVYDSFAVVQSGLLAAGMEYPGLVIISDNQRSAEIHRDVIVHEAAHQWWYGMVGNNQIAHAWLDEAIAEYSATLFYEEYQSYGIDYDDRIRDAMSGYVAYCDIFASSLDTSMSRKIPEYRSSLEYVYTSYTKGQIMYDTLRRLIGVNNFMAALKDYYNDNVYKIAVPDNLIASFEAASKRKLDGFFNTWISGDEYMFTG